MVGNPTSEASNKNTLRNVVQRPRRWDKPLSEKVTGNKIDWILSSHRFDSIAPESFPKSLSLRDILKNDCRVHRYKKDELIVHAGAYINSAYLILSGKALLVLSPGLDPSAWGQTKNHQTTVFASIKKWLFRNRMPEVRTHVNALDLTRQSNTINQNRVFINNLSDLLSASGAETESLTSNDIFGESAVLGRNMMTNSVIAQTNVEVLEIRWQGLRDICKWSPKFKNFVDFNYRERGLYEHLLSVPLLKDVPNDKIRALAGVATFEVYGEFEWQQDFQKTSKQAHTEEDVNQLIEAEPLIAQEGNYPDGLLLIRNGFARLSRHLNYGHYTIGHIASGGLFGLQEIYDSWSTGEDKPLTSSIRALGYTDVIRIPSYWLEKYVFESKHTDVLMSELQQTAALQADQKDQKLVDRKFTEFLVENRYINGTETMMIDLERCIRCDDCVTACANAHDNNPRFNRHGKSFGRYMIANACMHCEDPVCMIGCPTGAIHRSEDGVVSINDPTCIGCSSCANNCPYDNIQMVPVRDKNGKFFTDEKSTPIVKATKCDLCSETSGKPACERACSHDALIRIDLKDITKLADWVGR